VTHATSAGVSVNTQGIAASAAAGCCSPQQHQCDSILQPYQQQQQVLLCCEGLGTEQILAALSSSCGTWLSICPHQLSVEAAAAPAAAATAAADIPTLGPTPCTKLKCSIGFQTEELHHQRCQELQLLLLDVVSSSSSSSSSLQVHGGRNIKQHGRQGRHLMVKMSTQWLLHGSGDC